MSLYTAAVNFDSDSWVVVKLSVTINCLYNQPVSEQILNTAGDANDFLVRWTVDCAKQTGFVSTFKYCGLVLKCAQCAVHTPPVSPKILSRSGGARMSLPTTDFLNPGAYCSTQSNAEEADKHILYHWNRLISIHTFKQFIHFRKHFLNFTIHNFKKVQIMASYYDCA